MSPAGSSSGAFLRVRVIETIFVLDPYSIAAFFISFVNMVAFFVLNVYRIDTPIVYNVLWAPLQALRIADHVFLSVALVRYGIRLVSLVYIINTVSVALAALALATYVCGYTQIAFSGLDLGCFSIFRGLTPSLGPVFEQGRVLRTARAPAAVQFHNEASILDGRPGARVLRSTHADTGGSAGAGAGANTSASASASARMDMLKIVRRLRITPSFRSALASVFRTQPRRRRRTQAQAQGCAGSAPFSLQRPEVRSRYYKTLVRAVFIAGAFFCCAVGLFAVVEFQPRQETYNFIDLTYFVLVSIATIGYGDIAPRSTQGRACLIGVVLFSMVFMPIFLSRSVAQLRAERRLHVVKRAAAGGALVLAYQTTSLVRLSRFSLAADVALGIVGLAEDAAEPSLLPALSYVKSMAYVNASGAELSTEFLANVGAHAARVILCTSRSAHEADNAANYDSMMLPVVLRISRCMRPRSSLIFLTQDPANNAIVRRYLESRREYLTVLSASDTIAKILVLSVVLPGFSTYLLNFLMPPHMPLDTLAETPPRDLGDGDGAAQDDVRDEMDRLLGASAGKPSSLLSGASSLARRGAPPGAPPRGTPRTTQSETQPLNADQSALQGAPVSDGQAESTPMLPPQRASARARVRGPRPEEPPGAAGGAEGAEGAAAKAEDASSTQPSELADDQPQDARAARNRLLLSKLFGESTQYSFTKSSMDPGSRSRSPSHTGTTVDSALAAGSAVCISPALAAAFMAGRDEQLVKLGTRMDSLYTSFDNPIFMGKLGAAIDAFLPNITSFSPNCDATLAASAAPSLHRLIAHANHVRVRALYGLSRHLRICTATLRTYDQYADGRSGAAWLRHLAPSGPKARGSRGSRGSRSCQAPYTLLQSKVMGFNMEVSSALSKPFRYADLLSSAGGTLAPAYAPTAGARIGAASIASIRNIPYTQAAQQLASGQSTLYALRADALGMRGFAVGDSDIEVGFAPACVLTESSPGVVALLVLSQVDTVLWRETLHALTKRNRSVATLIVALSESIADPALQERYRAVAEAIVDDYNSSLEPVRPPDGCGTAQRIALDFTQCNTTNVYELQEIGLGRADHVLLLALEERAGSDEGLLLLSYAACRQLGRPRITVYASSVSRTLMSNDMAFGALYRRGEFIPNLYAVISAALLSSISNTLLCVGFLEQLFRSRHALHLLRVSVVARRGRGRGQSLPGESLEWGRAPEVLDVRSVHAIVCASGQDVLFFIISNSVLCLADPDLLVSDNDCVAVCDRGCANHS